MKAALRRAFGLLECALALALIALATWGIAETILRRAAAPAWMHPVREAWI